MYRTPFLWPKFYLEEKKDGSNNIFERLDRGLANSEWLNLFPTAHIQHHTFTTSDHCQISLNLALNKSFKCPPFRFEKMWSQRSDYMALVAKVWNNRFEGSNMCCLTKKLKLLKSVSKEWNKTKFGNIFRQLKKVDQNLENIQIKLHSQPNNQRAINKQTIFLSKRECLINFNVNYWKQKAKNNHLKLGDTNSKYFQTCATIRKNRNFIKKFLSKKWLLTTRPNLNWKGG